MVSFLALGETKGSIELMNGVKISGYDIDAGQIFARGQFGSVVITGENIGPGVDTRRGEYGVMDTHSPPFPKRYLYFPTDENGGHSIGERLVFCGGKSRWRNEKRARAEERKSQKVYIYFVLEESSELQLTAF